MRKCIAAAHQMHLDSLKISNEAYDKLQPSGTGRPGSSTGGQARGSAAGGGSAMLKMEHEKLIDATLRATGQWHTELTSMRSVTCCLPELVQSVATKRAGQEAARVVGAGAPGACAGTGALSPSLPPLAQPPPPLPPLMDTTSGTPGVVTGGPGSGGAGASPAARLKSPAKVAADVAEAELAELKARLHAAERAMARESITSPREITPSSRYVASGGNRGMGVTSWVAGEGRAGGPRPGSLDKLRGTTAAVVAASAFAPKVARVVPSASGGGVPGTLGVAPHGQSRLPPLLPLKPSGAGGGAAAGASGSAAASKFAQDRVKLYCVNSKLVSHTAQRQQDPTALRRWQNQK